MRSRNRETAPSPGSGFFRQRRISAAMPIRDRNRKLSDEDRDALGEILRMLDCRSKGSAGPRRPPRFDSQSPIRPHDPIQGIGLTATLPSAEAVSDFRPLSKMMLNRKCIAAAANQMDRLVGTLFSDPSSSNLTEPLPSRRKSLRKVSILSTLVSRRVSVFSFCSRITRTFARVSP